MELKHYAELLGRRMWFIIMLPVLSGVLALVITQYVPPQFEATTTFVITGRTSVNDLTPEMMQRLTGTYIELAQQQTVLDAVIDELGLATTARQLGKRIAIERVPESLLIELRVQDTNSQRAATIANVLVRTLRTESNALLGNDPMLSRFSLHVVEAALPPDNATFPWLLLNVAVAMAAGAVAAIGIVLLNDYLDDAIHTSTGAAYATGLTTMATITTIRKGFSLSSRSDVVAQYRPDSPIVEEYRLLRTHIEAASNQQAIRTLVVLSSSQGEGKSQTIANLAVVLARAGQRVILVDANLRQPRLHLLFDRPNTQGLTTALGIEHVAESMQHVQATEVDNLSLLASGPLPPNPAELLGSPDMLRLLEHLGEHADIVLCDTPALLEVSDATILARRCDAALLVVQANATRSITVRAALQRLDQFGIHAIGVVLSRAASHTHSVVPGFSSRLRQQPEHSGDDYHMPQPQAKAVVARRNGHRTEGMVSGSTISEPSLHIIHRKHNDSES